MNTAVAITTNPQPHHAPTEMELEIARLRAENARLLANKNAKGTSLKISTKGAVSVYGLGRFPVTLYAGQWDKVKQMMPEIEAFIVANAASLASKNA